MTDVDLRAKLLRYGVVGGGSTAALAVGVAVALQFPLKLLSMLLIGIPLLLVPAMVGLTDAGIDTAASSAYIGHSGSGNPSDYQPDSLPVPNKLELVCWLSGVGVAGVLLAAVVA